MYERGRRAFYSLFCMKELFCLTFSWISEFSQLEYPLFMRLLALKEVDGLFAFHYAYIYVSKAWNVGML